MEKKQNIGKVLHNFLLYSVFGFYLFILFALLFLKRTSFRSINLVPFQSIMNHLHGDALARAFALNNILGNIVLFFPLGVYIALLNRNKKVSFHVCFIALVSILAECAQYGFSVGTADVEDVILNTVGGFMGIFTFQLIDRFLGEKARLAVEILAPIAAIATILLFLLNQNH